MTHPDDTIPYGFCHCGCGQTTPIITHTQISAGRRKGEPAKYVRFHQRRSKNVEYTVDEETGCWNWQRSMLRTGYGKACIGPKVVGAHRLFYMRFKGDIPPGLHVHHICHNRRCVNPDHLEAVSPAENARAKAEVLLTQDDVREIRLLAGTIVQWEIAARFGVAASTIGNIVARNCWKDVV